LEVDTPAVCGVVTQDRKVMAMESWMHQTPSLQSCSPSVRRLDSGTVAQPVILSVGQSSSSSATCSRGAPAEGQQGSRSRRCSPVARAMSVRQSRAAGGG
jgi:hypothetical protein